MKQLKMRKMQNYHGQTQNDYKGKGFVSLWHKLSRQNYIIIVSMMQYNSATPQTETAAS